jgi:hypothetical protein
MLGPNPSRNYKQLREKVQRLEREAKKAKKAKGRKRQSFHKAAPGALPESSRSLKVRNEHAFNLLPSRPQLRVEFFSALTSYCPCPSQQGPPWNT